MLLVALLAAGTLGYAAVGTLFAAMLVRARSRDVMLPILLYPITIPVIIAGVRGTAALFQATPDDAGRAVLAGAADVLRRGVRHAGALDVRAADDRIEARADGSRESAFGYQLSAFSADGEVLRADSASRELTAESRELTAVCVSTPPSCSPWRC